MPVTIIQPSPHAGTRPRPLRMRAGNATLGLFALIALLASFSSSGTAQEPPAPAVLFEAVRESLNELPADRFDLTAVVDEVRAGEPADMVAALFEWVRGQTGYSAYRGVLKGPAGVLMDRTGNSLDRAFLLQGLLTAAGEQAILATGQLDVAAAAAATSALRPAPSALATSATPHSSVYADRLATTFGADAAAAAQRLAQAEAARASLSDELLRRTEAQTAELQRLLAGALPEQPATAAAALLTDHWWVQVMRDGAWLDLDPTMADAQPGQVLTAATARFGPTSLGQIAAVEGSCRDLACGERIHSVVVRALSERWDGAELSETLLVERELLPADLLGQHITFAAVAKDWPQDLDLFGQTQPLDVLRSELLATTAWDTQLVIGDDVFGDMSVNDDGTTAQKAGGGGVGGFGGAIGGGFGGGFGGGGGSDGGEFTALWLEFEIRTPGDGIAVHRRAIFDLVGPAARAAGLSEFAGDEATRLLRAATLAGETQIGFQPARLHPAVLSAAAANRLLAGADEWSRLYYEGSSLDPEFLVERQNAMAALTSPLEVFGLARAQAAEALAAAGYPTADTALTVTLYHRAFDLNMQPYGSYDIVASQAQGAPEAALRQGVADSNLEAILQERYEPVAEGEQAVAAVATAFAADVAAGRPWSVVNDATELANVSPDLTADLRQRVLDDLAAGYLVVVPNGGSGAVGWWRIDRATGAAIGMGDRGWGQAMTEYDVVTSVILQLRTVLNQYAAMAQCLGIALTQPLRGETGISEELAQCMFNLVCGQLNTAINTLMVTETNWTNVILSATIDALWGGAPEVGFGGFCGGLWNRISGG
ncbi:MAG TPA: hypothetical protein VKZ43_09375 [Trueperaceae bacterium]|nr:hypothetical protein [Trueperaceae bacterium]